MVASVFAFRQQLLIRGCYVRLVLSHHSSVNAPRRGCTAIICRSMDSRYCFAAPNLNWLIH
jgi:hypothetical protein